MKISEGGFLITKIHHLSSRIFSKKLKEYEIEISPGQGRILFALWQQDGVPIGELADRTQLGKSTLTDMLERMESEKLIKRVPSAVDKRKILIHLTENTKRLHRKYQQVSQEMIDLFYHDFASNEIEEFEAFLTRLLDNLVVFQKENG
ncbi:MAG: MarR family winged helix-turn-helix transcriptional regulator [Candidatus Thorarchaeota archaeon]